MGIVETVVDKIFIKMCESFIHDLTNAHPILYRASIHRLYLEFTGT